MARGTFRADLLHRIGVWRFRVPPLRERIEDIPILVATFQAPGSPAFSVEAMERLVSWQFPGNVRELKNVVETATVRAESAGSANVSPEHLPPELVGFRQEVAEVGARSGEDAALRIRVETALELRKGNVAQVARDLGVSRPWLYTALERLGIDPMRYRR